MMQLLLQALYTVACLQTSFSMVMEPANHHATGWKQIGRTDPEKHIKLYFALKNENINELEELFLSVSTPGHVEYGHHRSIPELRLFTAPSQSAIDSVMNLLSNFDVQIESSNRDLLSISTTVSNATSLLNCTYFDYVYQSMIVSRLQLGTTYELNDDIAKHLYFVSPTIRFPIFDTIFPITQVRQVTDSKVTPLTLRALYNVGSASGSAPNNIQGIASFKTEFYDISDLHRFWSAYNISSCNVTNIPSNSSSGDSLEAELDTQYISSLGESISMQVWLTEGNKFLDDLYQFTENVLNATNPPDLFSISYGVDESDISGSYLDKLNNQFMLMGTAGISVLFAAGDLGAGGGCLGYDAQFEPTWPAASPYVTAVGGVYGGTIGQSPTGEQVWPYGGGGFSNVASVQPWQTDAVSYYLTNVKNKPPSIQYNRSGRGFPDISAQSVDFEIYMNGKVKTVSGTSCASPTAAGIFALLNDLRKQNKMSNMGFLNPFIYQTVAKDPNAFNDVTKGTTYGCQQNLGYELGFEAFEKWDPASGVGTPNYAKLSTYALQTGLQTLKLEN